MRESTSMMKKIGKSSLVAAAAAALLVGLAGVAAAQPQGARGDRMEHRLQRLTQELQLSAGQVAQLRTVFQQARQERQAFRNGQGPARGTPEAREARRAFHDRMKQRIGQILTADQRQRFQQLRQEHGGRRGGHGCRDGRGHHGRGGGRRGNIDA